VSARFTFRARGWRAAAAGVEQGVDELEDGALIAGGQLFDALELLEGTEFIRLWYGPDESSQVIRMSAMPIAEIMLDGEQRSRRT
jgi:hypothetical protein